MKISHKFFLFLICASFFSSCALQNKQQSVAAHNNTAAKLNKKELIAALNNSVFCISIIIKGKNFEKRFSVGTGFLIGEGLIASAFHVQTKAEEMPGKFLKNSSVIVAWKRFETGEVIEIPINIAQSDEKGDLAIYRFDPKILSDNPKSPVIKPLVLAENLPPLGAEVVSIGYYGEYEFPFNSLGNVAMIDVNEDIFSDLTLMPGNSGAPVCDLETAEVLGVTTDVLDLGNETVRYGIAKRSAKLRELLKKITA
jgi:S1-C subfamily serine protease